MGMIGTSARADLIITVQEDAGPVMLAVDVIGSPTGNLVGANLSVTTADYQIDVISGKADQTASLSELLSATVSIANTTGSSGHVLHISITGTGYTSPVTPPNINGLSHIGGTVAQEGGGAGDSLSFSSAVSGATYAPPGPFSAQTPSIAATGSYSSDQGRTITSLAGPFAISQTLDIQLNDLNDQINYSSSTTLTSAVPEPSSLAFAALGVLSGIGYGLRRRMAGASELRP
jgi:hypothetical protein